MNKFPSSIADFLLLSLLSLVCAAGIAGTTAVVLGVALLMGY